jgi:hypothetical protein
MEKTQANSLVISRMHDAILRDIYTFHYLSLDQVMRLRGYHPASASNCRKLLKQLTDVGFLDSPKLPRAYLGNPPYVYTLGRSGLNYLKDQGYDIEFRFRPNEHAQPSYSWLNHTMALNDFLICASLLEKSEPSIVLETLFHEWIIKRRFFTHVEVKTKTETGSTKEKVGVIPDGFLNFRFLDNTHMPIIFEMDLSQESKWKIKQNLQARILYVKGPYQKLFDTTHATVAYAVAGGDTHRRDMLLDYCEQVLNETFTKDMADTFLFCALPPGLLDPRQIFLSPLWHHPFDFELLERTEANARFPNTRFVSCGDGYVKRYHKPLVLLE